MTKGHIVNDVSNPHPIDPRVYRDCCGCFAADVTFVRTLAQEAIHGATVSAFMPVSLDPP